MLVAAYFGYGKLLEKVVKIDSKSPVPSATKYDGVDYIPLPKWKTFLIQLLNIAGIGPIFGAIMGACYGPVAFLWITLGGIFMGAVHDFLGGIIYVRNNGLSMPEIVGRYQGKTLKKVVVAISMLLLLLAAVVLLRSPASIYPIFGAALIIMALSLIVVLLTGGYTIPQFDFANHHSAGKTLPIIPTLFITIACGAISGFHSTQSPLMARCVKNEKECRSVFYGAMISESIIALIWAAIAMAFFGGTDGLNAAMAEHDAPWIVNNITHTTLGLVGGILAVLGVVVAPISSGDTALRSARLTIADALHLDQNKIWNRLLVTLPLFGIAVALLFIDFDIMWRYLSWANQALAAIMLWCIFSYLVREKVNYWIALIPAVLMTYICSCFVFVSKQFVGLGDNPISYLAAGLVCALVLFVEILYVRRHQTPSPKIFR